MDSHDDDDDENVCLIRSREFFSIYASRFCVYILVNDISSVVVCI